MGNVSRLELLSQSIEAFNETVKRWDLEFEALSTSMFEGVQLVQLMTDHIHIGYSSLMLNTRQSAQNPINTRVIAILPHGNPLLFWYRQAIKPNQVLVFNSNREMASVSQPGFNAYTLAVPVEWLERIADENNLTISPEEHVINCDTRQITELSNTLKDFLAPTNNSSSNEIEWVVYQMLDKLFTHSNCSNISLSLAKKSQVMARALEFIHAQNYNIPISSICQYTNTTERTLERTFKNTIGLSPKQYVKRYLLKRIEKELKYSVYEQQSIGDMAYKHGFRNHSEFSKSFKLLTGHLPSELI